MKKITITAALQLAFAITALAQDFDFDQVRAKSDAAKGQTVVFKGFYLGMPVQDALGLINHYMGLPQSSATPVEGNKGDQAAVQANEDFARALFGPLQEMGLADVDKPSANRPYLVFKRGNALVIAKSELDRPFAVCSSDGVVVEIELSREVQARLFDSANTPTQEFLQMFMNAYDIPSLEPMNVKLVANVLGFQQEAGLQNVLTHRNPKGYEVTYSGDIFWSSDDAKMFTQHTPEGHLTIRTIETARERESKFD